MENARIRDVNVKKHMPLQTPVIVPLLAFYAVVSQGIYDQVMNGMYPMSMAYSK
jgi:hypothetical protein